MPSQSGLSGTAGLLGGVLRGILLGQEEKRRNAGVAQQDRALDLREQNQQFQQSQVPSISERVNAETNAMQQAMRGGIEKRVHDEQMFERRSGLERDLAGQRDATQRYLGELSAATSMAKAGGGAENPAAYQKRWKITRENIVTALGDLSPDEGHLLNEATDRVMATNEPPALAFLTAKAFDITRNLAQNQDLQGRIGKDDASAGSVDLDAYMPAEQANMALGFGAFPPGTSVADDDVVLELLRNNMANTQEEVAEFFYKMLGVESPAGTVGTAVGAAGEALWPGFKQDIGKIPGIARAIGDFVMPRGARAGRMTREDVPGLTGFTKSAVRAGQSFAKSGEERRKKANEKNRRR